MRVFGGSSLIHSDAPTSVPSPTDDSQTGANLRVCADQSSRVRYSRADRERLERLVRDGNTPRDVVWRARIVRRIDGGGDHGPWQESADSPSLAPSLLDERRRRTSEGCDATISRQAIAAPKRSSRWCRPRETVQCDPLERAQHGEGCRHLLQLSRGP